MVRGFDRSDQVRNPDVVNDAFEGILEAVVPIDLNWQRRCRIAFLHFCKHLAASDIRELIQSHVVGEIDLAFGNDNDISLLKDIGCLDASRLMQRGTLDPTGGHSKLELSVWAGQNRRARQTLKSFAGDRGAD